MPPECLTEIERQRRHREELTLALAERLPLLTARRICQERRRQARANITIPPQVPISPALHAAPLLWWMRD